MIKAGGPVVVEVLTKPVKLIWESKKYPSDIYDSEIIALYKNNGDNLVCG